MLRISKDHFVYQDEMKRIGICEAAVFLTEQPLFSNKSLSVAYADIDTVVVFTELAKNHGPSVTNAIESIIPQFCKANGLVKEEVIFIERYSQHLSYAYIPPSFMSKPLRDTLDLVELDSTGTPHWMPLPEETFSLLESALKGI